MHSKFSQAVIVFYGILFKNISILSIILSSSKAFAQSTRHSGVTWFSLIFLANEVCSLESVCGPSIRESDSVNALGTTRLITFVVRSPH